MSILRANLKHLYQRRSFWFLGLFFGIVAFCIALAISKAVAKNKPGAFCAPGLWMLFAGMFIATLPIDVLTKPFSYCLPGHRYIQRKFLFSVGLPLSFLWSLSFLFFPGLNFIETLLACLSAFATFAIFYWLGVWIVFRFKNWGIVFSLFPLLMLGDKPLNISVFIAHTIAKSPLPMILLGGLVNFLAWDWLGRPELARRYCGVLWIGAFDAWNKEKMFKLRQARLAEMDRKKPGSIRISDVVERFFISKISGAETGSLRQYIWGSFYKSFGIIFSQRRQDWMRFLMLILPILCFLCYMPGGGKNIIFLMPGITVAYMSLWVYSSLLISGGRRQRFWSALSLAAAIGIFITIAVVLFVILTQLMAGIMPQLTVGGHEFVFSALNMKYSPVPFMMVPLTLTIGLIFHKKPMLAMLFAMVIFQIFFAMSIFGDLTIMNWRVQIGLVHIIIMLLCSWAIFVAVLSRICVRCCLVNQSR